MKNPKLRREMAENDSYGKYTSARRALAGIEKVDALYKVDEDTGEITKTLNGALLDMTDEEIQECENMRKCKYQQRRTIEKHVKFLFDRARNEQSILLFGTFTFTDEALKRKADTRRQKVRRTLSKVSDDFIMNIDYGKETEREHYHAIIEVPKENNTLYQDEKGNWKDKVIDDLYDFGFYSLVPVRIDEEMSAEKLTRYLVKLVFHSVKVTQTYVSVKKGSRYQEYKKKAAEQLRLGRSNGVRKRDERMDENYLQMDSLNGSLPWY